MSTFSNILSYVSNLSFNLKKSAMMNKYSPSENRYVAYEYFKDKANKFLSKSKKEDFEEIINLFLARLAINVQNSIKDAEEKEYIKDFIKTFDKDLISKLLKDYITKYYVIAHAIEILMEKEGKEETLNFLDTIITTEDTLFDDPLVEKRIEVLKNFAGETNTSMLQKAKHFLKDSDDRLVIAAIRFIKDYSYKNSSEEEEIADIMINKFLDLETSSRIRMELLHVFAKNDWKINSRKQVEELLPEGFFINSKGFVRTIKNLTNID